MEEHVHSSQELTRHVTSYCGTVLFTQCGDILLDYCFDEPECMYLPEVMVQNNEDIYITIEICIG